MKHVSFYQTFALNWLRKCWQTGDRWLIGRLMSGQPFVRARHFLYFSNERDKKNNIYTQNGAISVLKFKWIGNELGGATSWGPLISCPLKIMAQSDQIKGTKRNKALKKINWEKCCAVPFLFCPWRGVPKVDSWPKRDQTEMPKFSDTDGRHQKYQANQAEKVLCDVRRLKKS